MATITRPRTLTVPMHGDDVANFQRALNTRFERWDISRVVAADGAFGKDTELAAKQAALALGLLASAYRAGITPRIRSIVRNPNLRTPAQKRRARRMAGYRAKLRKRYAGAGVGTITPGMTPKRIIDEIVIPIARLNSINVTPGSVAAANASHGPTVGGTRSDHQGPPNVAWAADMSNGGSPTPQMDALAADLAQEFGIAFSGSGLANRTANGFRYQLIYRTNIGGNHFNHVHFGVRKV